MHCIPRFYTPLFPARNSMSIPRQVRLCSRFFRVCVFGCLVALAAACPYRASANDLTICKTTVPPTGTSGPFFAFTGANGFPTGQKSFNSLYLSNQSIFKLQDSTSNPANCQIFNITGNDQLNKITETVPPPPWKLTNISCTSGKSVVRSEERRVGKSVSPDVRRS